MAVSEEVDACVCLDACGQSAGALGSFVRRRTGSETGPRPEIAFAPGGYGAVGGTHSASRRSRSFLAAPANPPLTPVRFGAWLTQ